MFAAPAETGSPQGNFQPFNPADQKRICGALYTDATNLKTTFVEADCDVIQKAYFPANETPADPSSQQGFQPNSPVDSTPLCGVVYSNTEFKTYVAKVDCDIIQKKYFPTK